MRPEEKELLDQWIEEKFYVVAAEELYAQVNIGDWDRIDPWVAEHIESFGKLARFQGGGNLQGSMVVKVQLEDPLGDDEEDSPTGVWPFSALQRHGYNPLNDAEVAEFVAGEWAHLFEEDEVLAYEALGSTLWIPRGLADANADGASTFARVAGGAGFYVFDVKDKIVLGVDYDASLSDRWASLYKALTGRDPRRLAG